MKNAISIKTMPAFSVQIDWWCTQWSGDRQLQSHTMLPLAQCVSQRLRR